MGKEADRLGFQVANIPYLQITSIPDVDNKMKVILMTVPLNDLESDLDIQIICKRVTKLTIQHCMYIQNTLVYVCSKPYQFRPLEHRYR